MNLETLRHSTAHVLARAVKALWPDVKLGIGPSIENGFYYDFDKKEPFTPEDLSKIEEKMHQIIRQNQKFIKNEMTKEKARKLFKDMGEDYKVELIKGILQDTVTIYSNGDFTDLCKGPHLSSTGKIETFALTHVAGAYWKGNAENPMLQRIYGTAFTTQKELDKHLKLIEEAKKRDHRKLGKELEFFIIDESAGAGLIIYQPKGALLRDIIEDWEKKEHLRRGYQLAIGPHIMKADIWIRSGHYDYYKELMYIFDIEGAEYAIKPMNCPAHMLIYKSAIRSYRDLPLRYFELGTVYRHEKSGVLHGLLRVRGFTQDDAHIFCLPEQLTDEIKAIIDFVLYALKVFGFKDYCVELSTMPEKHIGTDKDWEKATEALRKSLEEKKMKYDINEGEGAFYGPKIDIKLKDALGRFWQCATIQCDFALPERFKLTYTDKDGEKRRPITLHRVILGSMERFLGALIEHYAGALPVWLSPTQVMVMPITDKQKEYAGKIHEDLKQSNIRSEIDMRSQTIGYKIREAQKSKIPYMLIIGAKEQKENAISVRSRKKGDEGKTKPDRFIRRILKEVKSYS
ncbi:MAG: threonine--tRNA ligase [Candidatus Omnitrophota bacterium]|nr:MAG: threonine--tRNA ligase [Candidatus Omnitrophota bacterium]